VGRREHICGSGGWQNSPRRGRSTWLGRQALGWLPQVGAGPDGLKVYVASSWSVTQRPRPESSSSGVVLVHPDVVGLRRWFSATSPTRVLYGRASSSSTRPQDDDALCPAAGCPSRRCGSCRCRAGRAAGAIDRRVALGQRVLMKHQAPFGPQSRFGAGQRCGVGRSSRAAAAGRRRFHAGLHGGLVLEPEDFVGLDDRCHSEI
jgi:hypothetical protein